MISISFTKFKDRDLFDLKNGSTFLPFKSEVGMWIFRMWIGTSLHYKSFGVGLLGFSLIFSIKRN